MGPVLPWRSFSLEALLLGEHIRLFSNGPPLSHQGKGKQEGGHLGTTQSDQAFCFPSLMHGMGYYWQRTPKTMHRV